MLHRMRTCGMVGVVVAALCAACGDDDASQDASLDVGPPEGWSELSDLPAMRMPKDVWVFSDTNVWLIGLLTDGTALYRYDGASWSTVETPASSGPVTCIYALSPSSIWLCAGERVLHHDGAAFTEMAVSGIVVEDVWASSESDVIAVGWGLTDADRTVARYDGVDWTDIPLGSGAKGSVWGAATDDVYVSDRDMLLHWDGDAWTEVDGVAGGPIWGTGASDVWVLDGYDAISHHDGDSWDTVPTAGAPTAIWGASPDDLWAGGSETMTHYDGASWNEVLDLDRDDHLGGWTLQKIHGSSATNVWAAGLTAYNQPFIYRHDH